MNQALCYTLILIISNLCNKLHGKYWPHFPDEETETKWGHITVLRVSSVQLHSRVWFFVTPLTAAGQAFLSIVHSQSLLKLMSIESVMPSNHLILCHPLFLLFSIFPSIRVFSNESVLCIRWWSLSFSISPFNEYSGLISLRIDWFGLLAVQGTLKSLFQHLGSEVSILHHSAFYIVQVYLVAHQ